MSEEKKEPTAGDYIERIKKISHDLAFWKEQYAKLEDDLRKATGQVVKQQAELVDLRDTAAKSTAIAATAVKQRDQIRSLLVLLLDHTAGRTGGLSTSQIFCAVCENAAMCPHKKIREFLREMDEEVLQPQPEGEAA